MLSDFYLLSPLPPLPFHSSKDCVDDLTLPSDDLSHSSLLFDEQAGLSLPPLLATRSSHHEHYHHPALLLEEEYDCSMELARALAGIDDEEGVTTSPAHHLHDQTEFSTSSTSASLSSSSLSSSSSNYPQPTNWHQPTPGAPAWHPDCPDCVAATSGHALPATLLLAEGSGRQAGSPATATALRSPGDTTDGGQLATNENATMASMSVGGGYLEQRPSMYMAMTPPAFASPPSGALTHSWEGSGYFGPVPRTLSSSSPVPCQPSTTSHVVDPPLGGFDGSFDGSTYSSTWPASMAASSSSSPSMSSFFNDSSAHFPASYQPSYTPETLLPCADMSPSSGAMGMIGSVTSPLATACMPLSSSSASSYPYPSNLLSSASAGSPWFSASPPVATLLPAGPTLVPLATALPVEPRPAGGDAAQKRKRAQQPPNNPGRPGSPHVCTECGADKTPEWRRGPCGPRTLCNACGLRYAKRNKKKKEEELAAASGQPASQPRKPRSRTASPVPGGRRSPTPIPGTAVPHPPAEAATTSTTTPTALLTTTTALLTTTTASPMVAPSAP